MTSRGRLRHAKTFHCIMMHEVGVTMEFLRKGRDIVSLETRPHLHEAILNKSFGMPVSDILHHYSLHKNIS